MTNLNSIAVFGAGSWGTALAIQLARNNQQVRLWGNDAEKMTAMQVEHCNTRYLPDIRFPENLQVFSDLSAALKDVEDILIVVPSQAFRSVLELIKPYLNKKTRLAWATKGLDQLKHQLLHEVVKEILGEMPAAILSGPSFAKEVAQGLPTAITLASYSEQYAIDLSQRFHGKQFRVYTSQDMAGVELGGAMKNVLAIAVGLSDGLGFGANARCALITRGLAEMTRLGLVLGAQRETFMGLAGLGDLVLTCTDNQSRNRRFGLALGSGISAEQAEQQIGQVVEGIRTAKEMFYFAKHYATEIPICEQVYRILHEGLDPKVAVNNLLSREQKME